MSIEQIKQAIPDYAKDIRLNLSSVLSLEGSMGLSQQQIDGIALASAYATRDARVIEAISGYVGGRLDEPHQVAVKSAVAIMAMNNVYYRFVHLNSDKDYMAMPAKLRMNVIANHGIDSADFELYSLAVSAINGCGMCMDAHSKQLLKAGVSKEGVQASVRIAAVIHALVFANL